VQAVQPTADAVGDPHSGVPLSAVKRVVGTLVTKAKKSPPVQLQYVVEIHRETFSYRTV